MTFKEYFKLFEEFRDISTEEKLYHQTNAINLFKIMESGYLMPRKFLFGSSNLNKTYGERMSPSEIATGRKSTYSKLDNLSPEQKKAEMASLSREIGFVRFELYKDRLKTNKYVRGLKIKPIAEFAISERNKIADVLKKNKNILPPGTNIEKEVEFLLKTGINLSKPRTIKKITYALVNAREYLKKLDRKDFEELFDGVNTGAVYSEEKENEERLVFTGKNETRYKDDFLNDKNDRIYLNPQIMKINLLPGFTKEFLNSVAPVSFVKYYNKMKNWHELFNSTPEYTAFTSLMKKYIAGKIGQEELVAKGLDPSNIKKYEKEYKKPYLPTPEQRKEVSKDFNARTGAKKLPGKVIYKKYSDEQMKKDIEDTKRKVMSKITTKGNA